MKPSISIDAIGEAFFLEYFGGDYGVTFQAHDTVGTVCNVYINGFVLQRLAEMQVELLQDLAEHVLGKQGSASFTVRYPEGGL